MIECVRRQYQCRALPRGGELAGIREHFRFVGGARFGGTDPRDAAHQDAHAAPLHSRPMAQTRTTGDTADAAPPVRRWSEALRVYLEPASLRMFFLGFAAGLPLLLVLGTLSFRMREAGIDRSTIGFFSWVGLAYGIKWVWAPLVDRLPLPWLTRALGRRRSWLLLAQAGVIAGLLGMAFSDPRAGLDAVVVFALVVAFA
jgi:PAT family beta-lactamase induction signal transducer AmpG